jgi:hypothetical protein
MWATWIKVSRIVMMRGSHHYYSFSRDWATFSRDLAPCRDSCGCVIIAVRPSGRSRRDAPVSLKLGGPLDDPSRSPDAESLH